MKSKPFQINIPTIKLFVLLVIVTGLITSCSSIINGGSAGAIQSRVLVFPKADYYAVIQGKKGIVALYYDINHLWFYANEGDQSLKSFTLSEDSGCDTPFYDMYETLPDGRLQVWKQCLTENGTITYLMAYDWQTKKLEELSGPLPLGSSSASWNPDQARAIGYLDSKFASKTLFWIWKGGFGPLDLVVGDESRSWNLQDDFPDFKAEDTGKTGTTGRAAWSPNGNQIAFFASPDAIGKIGFDRFNVKYNLYLMNVKTLQPHVVLDKIASPFVLKWSPDSKQIAFIKEQEGVWIYSLTNDSVHQVSPGNFNDILWAPDGKKLNAISCFGIHECTQIEEYDLTNILSP